MLRKEVDFVLQHLAVTLPCPGVVFYTRRITPDGSYLMMAGDCEGLTGWTVRQLMAQGCGWRRRVHPEDVERVDAALRDLAEGTERTIEYRFLGPEGEERWVRDSLSALQGAPGDPAEVVGLMLDVSVERRLRSQVSALVSRRWESQRMESLGALAGGVAHDFNNLLTTIITTTQLLEQDGVATPAARRDLRMIRDAAERGSGIVRQILRFAARREHVAGPVELNKVVADLEGILRRRLGPEIRLELKLGGELPAIPSDAAQLEQVILNLAVNAREAMRGGGDLRVETGRVVLDDHVGAEGASTLLPGEYVRLTVRDTGPGVPASVRDRIFEPFFTTKLDGSVGAGFGLSTVQRIVRGHGGGVVLDVSPGWGAVFHVYLPVRAGLTRQVAPELVSAALRPPSSGVRVLVVEDDPSVRELVGRALEGAGHAVVGVATASEGLRAFDGARPPFDAVVIDLVLPDRSGEALARALRRRRSHVAVLYMSGFGESEEQDRERGVFLLKPFSSVDLSAALGRALAQAAAGPRPDKHVGPRRVDHA